MYDAHIVAIHRTAVLITLDKDQRIVCKIHIALVPQKAIGRNLSIWQICIGPYRPRVLKLSRCIAGRLRDILNEKHRISYRIVQGVVKVVAMIRGRRHGVGGRTKRQQEGELTDDE